jgi:hypothetical protein
MINQEKLRKYLIDELASLIKSEQILQKSHKSCESISLPFSFNESEKIDALTVRLARSSDIYTQKILSSILLLLKENTDGFIDKINLCEKMGIIDSADDMKYIRDLRNSVTHDYDGDFINKIFIDTMKYTLILLKNITTTKEYLQQKFDIC